MIADIFQLAIEIGDMAVMVRTQSEEFARMLEDRYGSFVATGARNPVFELDIELGEAGNGNRKPGYIPDAEPWNRDMESQGEQEAAGAVPGAESATGDPYDRELSVRLESGLWRLERGDFYAELDPAHRRGLVRQAAQPYAIDGVLRILHSLLLVRQGGFLLHAASAVRNGRAFVFAGVSGAGKTTISRLAPPDVTLLTDEISYVRQTEYATGTETVEGIRETGQEESRETVNERLDAGSAKQESQPSMPRAVSCLSSYDAFGTPFAGELARIGTKMRAPLSTVFLLEQGPENRIEPVSDRQAARELMRHVLFFAHDPEMVGTVFGGICDLVSRVAVQRLVFTKDAGVWELIR